MNPVFVGSGLELHYPGRFWKQQPNKLNMCV